jgi:hypothetical protein
VQTPDWQVTFKSHALPSLHALPLGAVGFEHWPVAGLHVPATWHWSLAVQTTGVDGTQCPAPSHVGAVEHAPLPLPQVVPLGTFVTEHVPLPGSQADWTHCASAVETNPADASVLPLLSTPPAMSTPRLVVVAVW